MPYYVYILRCEDKSLYTGCTKNVDLRTKLHMNGKAARYTCIHKPEKIVYIEKFASRSEAMKKEKHIKKLRRKQKMELIRSKAELDATC